MKNRTYLISIATALAACAIVSGVASASASAACTPAAKTKYLYCVSANYLAGNQAVEATFGSSKLSATVVGGTAKLKCTGGKLTGTNDILQIEGKSKATLEFEGCAMENFTTECEVATTQTTNELEDALDTPTSRVEDTFKPVGATFIAITISSRMGQTCPIAQTFTIEGSQKCEVDANNATAKTEKETHELVCLTTGSMLKIGGQGANSAKFSGTATVKLPSKANWKVEEN